MAANVKSAKMPSQADVEKSHGGRSGSPGATPISSGRLGYHQAAGNLAVQRLLRSRRVQAKLTGNQPGDPYEQEADRIAAQVMRQPEPAVQRKAEEARGVPTMPSQGSVVPPGGRPLDRGTRSFFEGRFGQDFGEVRIHEGARASGLAGALQARAYTVGRDVVFAEGQYRPHSEEGRRLLAHELTHVVQNRATPGVHRRKPVQVTHPQEASERAADTVAEQVVQGEPADREALTQASPNGRIARDGPTSQTITTIDFDVSGEATESTVSFPTGEITDDRVINAASPFEGNVLVVRTHPRIQAIKVRSNRYIVTSELARAVVWSRLLFGTRAGAILQGPLLQPVNEQRYYVVGTDTNLRLPAATPGSGTEVLGGEVWGVGAPMYWNLQHRNAEGGLFVLRALITPDGRPFLPPSIRLAETFYAQLGMTTGGRGLIAPAHARRFIFGEIDRLIEAGETQQASNLLAELSAYAYQVLDFQTKVRYIRVLVDAWTFQAQERAVVEIMKSCAGRSELLAIVDQLRRGGIFDQMFDDLDSEIWNLLVEVGRKFGEPGGLSIDDLIELAVSLGLELSPAPSLNPLEQLEEAWHSLNRFALGMLEGVLMLITEPDKVVEGLVQLGKLMYTLERARWGDPEAIQFLNGMLMRAANAVMNGMKGARLLGVTQDVVRRVKWAIIWEVASWFVGIGEVKALLSTGRGARAAAMARIGGALGAAGRFADAARVAGKIETVASLMGRASRIGGRDVMRYLSHLPDEDLVRLGRAVEGVDVDRAARIADLGADASAAANHALERVRALQTLERKLGSLSGDVVAGFQRMARHAGFSNDELLALVNALPEGNAELFMHVMANLPDGAFRGLVGGRGRSYGFFADLAQSPAATGFIFNHGYETFSRIYARSGYNMRTFERNMDAINDILGTLDTPTARRSFLDRLRDGDDAAWLEVRDAKTRRRAAGGQVPSTSGTPRTRPDGTHVWDRIDGVTIEEYEIGRYGHLLDNRGTTGYFQAHHAIQDAWAQIRIPGYQRRRAPAILLRDSHAGTPHRIITDRQAARASTMGTRTYADERALLIADLNAAGVPGNRAAQILRECDTYFGAMYQDLARTMNATELRGIFGAWTP